MPRDLGVLISSVCIVCENIPADRGTDIDIVRVLQRRCHKRWLSWLKCTLLGRPGPILPRRILAAKHALGNFATSVLKSLASKMRSTCTGLGDTAGLLHRVEEEEVNSNGLKTQLASWRRAGAPGDFNSSSIWR